MSQNFVNPTYYNLQRAVIRSEYSNIGELDVTALIPALSLTTSIDSETIFGSARFIDSVGILDGDDDTGRDPLRGEEIIIFEIADSQMINENGGEGSGEVPEPFRFAGYIYKIDNVQTKEINDAVTYDVHFISYQSFVAGTYQIIRSFSDESVSDVVRTIFNDYYGTPSKIAAIPPDLVKSLELQETDGVIRCTIPKMRPEEAMSFLSKRSYSTRSPSCTFRFFENFKSYHYVTDERLFELAEEDGDRIFDFTYLDSIPNTLEFFDEQRNNLEILENTRRLNSLDDIYNGAYRNKVYELDILSRNLNLIDETNQYDYFKERNKYLDVKPSQQVVDDRHTKDFIDAVHRADEDIQKEWLVIQNYTTGERTGDNSMQAETYYADIISNRQAYSKHISNITVDASGPGRLDISAGDIINLSVKKFVFADNNESGAFEENKRLSGRYIVKSVTYNMEHEEMSNTYTLIKRDWSEVTMRTFRGGR
jgi:hypothetical protein